MIRIASHFAAAFPGLFDGIKLDDLSLDSIGILIGNIIRIMLAFSGILAVIIITYAGIKYITSQGDSAKVKNAKDTLFNAITGLILAGAAYMIVSFLASRFS